MKICFISDTHNKHKQLNSLLPEADVIVHCGDITSMGHEHEIVRFFKWFGSLKYEHKIFIAGNHDFLFETNQTLAKTLIPDNVIYLEDNEVIINNVKFYGSPVTNIFMNWAFMREECKLHQHWSGIPDDVDVLITHSPPKSILDIINNKNIGSSTLYDEVINRIKPKIHAFGHIHAGYGKYNQNGIQFVNCAILNEQYYVENNPIVIEI